MLDKLIELILTESQWMPFAMLLSFIATGSLAVRQARGALSPPARILSAMNLFYGCMIGIMGSGHLLAVVIKIAQGTLEGSPLLLLLLGIALVIPAGWLALRAIRHEQLTDGQAVAVNIWLAIFLIALGPHNLPLAAPAALNLAYRFHSRRAVGWTVATVAAAGYLALFVGSLIFFASGKSFEEFQGIGEYSQAVTPP